LGRHFFILTKDNIENKEEVISLQVGEEEISYDIPEIKKNYYERKNELQEKKKTIAELISIHFNTPSDELERSLTNNYTFHDVKEKFDMDNLMDSPPKVESQLAEVYEELERKEDDEPSSPELKPLEENLRYEFLDEEGKCPIFINEELSTLENEN
jgi:hypothetical protein